MDDVRAAVLFVSTSDAGATEVAWEAARQSLATYLAVREPSLNATTCDAHLHASEGRVSVMVRKPLTEVHVAAHRLLAAELSAFGFVRIDERVTRGEGTPDPFERWDWPGPDLREPKSTASD